jgi:L-arabinose transport system substrate-binding protein
MMRQKSPARVATLSFVGLAAAIAASTAAKADDVKMGYFNKMGEHPWFVPKSPEQRPKPESSACTS